MNVCSGKPNGTKASIIPRNGLTEALRGLPAEQWIYLCAPAGCGKSVAARLWAAEAARHAVIALADAADLTFLPKLLARLPAGVQVMLLSRQEPSGPLSELVLKEKLALIGEETLKFSGREVSALFAAHSIPLTRAQAESIRDTADGWAIGINAVLLAGAPAPEGPLLSGHLESYIRTQLWERWDEDTREFMLQTAAEEELTPSLCEALTGRADSAARLEGLVREGAFIIRSGAGSYRFHALFRQFLRTLLAENPALAAAQTRRAAYWYYREESYYKAIDAFLRCGDERMALACIRELSAGRRNLFVIDKIIPIYRSPAVNNLVEKNEYLLILRAWVAFLDGRPADMERDSDHLYIHMSPLAGQNPYQCLLPQLQPGRPRLPRPAGKRRYGGSGGMARRPRHRSHGPPELSAPLWPLHLGAGPYHSRQLRPGHCAADQNSRTGPGLPPPPRCD